MILGRCSRIFMKRDINLNMFANIAKGLTLWCFCLILNVYSSSGFSVRGVWDVKDAISDSRDSLETFLEEYVDTVAIVPPDTSASDYLLEVRSKMLTAIAWPFERLLQPAISLIILPIRPPMEYVLDEKVVDRALAVATFGKRDQMMLYPTFSIKAPASSIGASYRHYGLFTVKSDVLVLNIDRFATNDYRLQSRYFMRGLFETPWGIILKARRNVSRNAYFPAPRTNLLVQYSDTTNAAEWGINYQWNTKLNLYAESGFMFRKFNFSEWEPASGISFAHDNFFFYDAYARGLYQNVIEVPWILGLNYDSRNTTFTATEGTVLQGSAGYHSVSENRDYLSFSFVMQKYFLLGKQQYRLNREEDRRNQKMLQSFNFRDAIDLFSPVDWRERWLERKVLVMQFRFRHMNELHAGRAPFFALSRLNTGTPLRGYSDDIQTDFSMAAISFEYRWPVLNLVDGVLFNEYGITGDGSRAWTLSNLRNSWGFGFRMRKDNLFLMRMQFGFHGASGITINMGVSPVY
jgi:hypothetical protein